MAGDLGWFLSAAWGWQAGSKAVRWGSCRTCLIYFLSLREHFKSETESCSVLLDSLRPHGDLGSIPGLGRCPGVRKGYPLQYSGLENSVDCIVHGVVKSPHDWVTFTSLHFIFKCTSSIPLFTLNSICVFLMYGQGGESLILTVWLWQLCELCDFGSCLC